MLFLPRVSMSMHVERDMAFTNSVCLSVSPTPALYQNEWIYRQTFWRSGNIILVQLRAVRRYKITWNPSAAALNVWQWKRFENIAI